MSLKKISHWLEAAIGQLNIMNTKWHEISIKKEIGLVRLYHQVGNNCTVACFF